MLVLQPQGLELLHQIKGFLLNFPHLCLALRLPSLCALDLHVDELQLMEDGLQKFLGPVFLLLPLFSVLNTLEEVLVVFPELFDRLLEVLHFLL